MTFLPDTAMKNLIYAIEQLGTTPTCDYTALGGQPQGVLTVVTMGESADVFPMHLGIGQNAANGTIVMYLVEEGIDSHIVKYAGTSTNALVDAEALEAQVNALAQQWLTAHGIID